MIHKKLLSIYISEHPYTVESRVEYIERHTDITYIFIPNIGTVMIPSDNLFAERCEISDIVRIIKHHHAYITHNLSKNILGIVQRKL